MQAPAPPQGPQSLQVQSPWQVLCWTLQPPQACSSVVPGEQTPWFSQALQAQLVVQVCVPQSLHSSCWPGWLHSHVELVQSDQVQSVRQN